ncbi:tRNA CCA-pyrophosphorylase [Streptococcus intermedius]|uniref:CCA-adding enzyme n=1 Tax=Streptococcus intermedius TaxID=1338 RepID=A0AAD1C8U5_STRIT|nr:CCA tRNA nucleotidyltransferase [Streptococcus intermedius]ALF27388.1 tRNA CCA-pyrophosphorylase [Streptococcus intermedius]ARC27282.1 CCA tRNA nucleotidyltransferase [Streptococcus intermedius]BAW17303.1 tRNA CCA-pyrophosphorylase [Streptococcus intermedius]
MRLENMPSEFQEALPVLKKIKNAGFDAYFVGGSVRDALLERPIHDVDIASSSYPEETKHIFERTIDVGIEHGTVLVLEDNHEYEVTTFRTEDLYVDYRRPSHVTFVRSLKEDLKRRDFTINALALDEAGNVIDLFEGLDDLKYQILRAVGIPSERFNEDALRIMRGFRFQASLGFTLDADTFNAMKGCVPLLEKISVERTFIEFDKLLTSFYWRKGLKSLIASGAMDYLPDMRNHQSQLETLFNFQVDFQFTSSEQAWAALLMALQVKNIKRFLKHWKTSNEFQKRVEQIVMIFNLRQTHFLDKEECYRFELDLIIQAEEIRQAQGLAIDFERIYSTYDSLTIHDKHEIVVNGGLLIKEFGFKPGPALGQLLTEIEMAIVNGVLDNRLEAILAFVEERK